MGARDRHEVRDEVSVRRVDGQDPQGVVVCEAVVEAEGGRLDILVNNAGANWGAPLAEFPDAAWDRVLDVNVKGVFHLTRELVPALSAASSQRAKSPRMRLWSAVSSLVASMTGLRSRGGKRWLWPLTYPRLRGPCLLDPADCGSGGLTNASSPRTHHRTSATMDPGTGGVGRSRGGIGSARRASGAALDGGAGRSPLLAGA